MEQISSAKIFSVSHMIRSMTVGDRLKIPYNVPYNTIRSAVRRISKDGYNITIEREKSNYLLIRNGLETTND